MSSSVTPPVFTVTQINHLNAYYNEAKTAYSSGSYSAVISYLEDYYEVQFGVDGYSQLAYAVVSDTTLNGMTPIDELEEDGITYGTDKSVRLMLSLAQFNLADISVHNNPPTISQIEGEHEQAYAASQISISYWGATPFASQKLNWMGTLATPWEASNLSNPDFIGLSSAKVALSTKLVIQAGLTAAYQEGFGNLTGPVDRSEFLGDAELLMQGVFLNTVEPVASQFINYFYDLENGWKAFTDIASSALNQFDSLFYNLGASIENGGGSGSGSSSSASISSTDGSSYIEYTLSPQGGGPSGAQDMVLVLADNVTFSASLQGQLILGTGKSDDLVAGNDDVTLFISDIGGTNILNAGTFQNVTEISFSGSTLASGASLSGSDGSNVFMFAGGDNVLVGDTGANTFIMSPSLTSSDNVIYGGGGASTYELYGDVVILYTHGTPTPQDIETLGLAAGSPSGTVNLTYIIDPGPNDVLMDPDGQNLAGSYVPYSEENDTPSGAVTYADFDISTDGVETLKRLTYPPFGLEPPGSFAGGPLSLDIKPSSPEDGVAQFSSPFDSQGDSYQLSLENFVNGDFGISFSGYFVEQYLNEYELVQPSDPNNVFNYTSKTYVTLVSSGAVDNVTSGNYANSVVVNSGGREFVQNGGISWGAVVDGGYEYVLSGGMASDSMVFSGGTESVADGGQTSADALSTGGTEYVSSGGQSADDIVNSGGKVAVDSAGTEQNATILNGGSERVNFGGQAYFDDVNGGLEAVWSGGSTVFAQVSGGGTLSVLSGGIASDSTVFSGGVEQVQSGAMETATAISGGVVYVSSGGTVASAAVYSGGALTVSNGGKVAAVTVAGGVTSIQGGSSTVLAGGGVATVEAAGSAVVDVKFTAYSTGGTLDFVNGSTAAQIVSAGGGGSVTAFGGAGGGFYAGGAGGNNSLIGGTGVVTLEGGGAGDVLQANGSAGQNVLLAGAGNESLFADSSTGANRFQLAPASYGVVSTDGAGAQTFFLQGTAKSGVTTITGSQVAGATDVYSFVGDSTVGGASYVINGFSAANSVIYFVNGADNGVGDASVTGVSGGSSAVIGLSDGTQITLRGVAAASLTSVTLSNGVVGFV